MSELSNSKLDVYRDSRTLWLVPSESSIENHEIVLARLCAPIRSLRWEGDPEGELKFVPEPDHWVFSWKALPAAGSMIKVVFDADPLLPQDCTPAKASGDGSVILFAHHATTHGEKLRYEPQWYKNTVGYWTVPTDYVTWELNVEDAGVYTVAVLQGCGEGMGGSEARISLQHEGAKVSELSFQTIDTGHFQNFRWHHLGRVEIVKPGKHVLRIDATKIAKVALFDVRAIHLVKQAK